MSTIASSEQSVVLLGICWLVYRLLRRTSLHIPHLPTEHLGSPHLSTMSSNVSLTPERAEQLVRLLTDGLVNIVDESGQFLLKCESQRSFR